MVEVGERADEDRQNEHRREDLLKQVSRVSELVGEGLRVGRQ